MANIFIVLIILHYIGDYYLQTKNVAERKEKNYLYILLHCALYALPAALSILLFDNSNYLYAVLLFSIAHFIIDSIKFFIKTKRYYPKTSEEDNQLLRVDIIYCADQFLHILTIVIISIVFLRYNSDITLRQQILTSLNLSTETFLRIIKSLAAFAVILKPVSLTFYKLFNVDLMAQPNDNNQSVEKAKGAGAIIGYMERILMMFLLIIGEYTAIGFVIAAKSIIRFNGKTKQEFFIIGTFYGIITTLVAYILFFKL